MKVLISFERKMRVRHLFIHFPDFKIMLCVASGKAFILTIRPAAIVSGEKYAEEEIPDDILTLCLSGSTMDQLELSDRFEGYLADMVDKYLPDSAPSAPADDIFDLVDK